MILTITFLVVAWLHPAQPTVVAQLRQPSVQGVELREPAMQDVALGPEHLTAVKTWEVK